MTYACRLKARRYFRLFGIHSGKLDHVVGDCCVAHVHHVCANKAHGLAKDYAVLCVDALQVYVAHLLGALGPPDQCVSQCEEEEEEEEQEEEEEDTPPSLHTHARTQHAPPPPPRRSVAHAVHARFAAFPPACFACNSHCVPSRVAEHCT